MANTIQVKRGAHASLPTLAAGELGFSTDTKQLNIGDGTANHEIVTFDTYAATSFLYATSDNTPQNKTPAEVMAILSGQAGADFSMNTKKLTNVLDPASAQDAATKAYVDSVATGLDVHGSCRVATAAALPACTPAGVGVGKTLTATAVGVLTVDNVATVLNNRILVKDQVAGADNGIYKVTTEGTVAVAFVLTRATDFDEAAEVTAGSFTFVSEGTANADKGWVLSTNDPITVDTTALTFSQFSGAGQIVAGAGLTKTGDTLDVGAGTGVTVGADSISVNYGATATTACVGNDSRLSDARTPTVHATTHVTGGSDIIANVVAAGNSGLMTGADKTKLDGIAAGAQPGTVTSVTGTSPVASSGGTTPAISMPAATSVAAGHATAAQIAKLDGIAAGANNYVHPNHSGDVTSVADGAQTIAADAVTYAKMQNAVAANVILGNVGIAGSIIAELTATQVRTMINVEDGAAADMTGAEIVTAINASASLIDDDNIAATIARDSEVSTAVSNHAALTTGIHGAGANTILHSASAIDGGAFA